MKRWIHGALMTFWSMQAGAAPLPVSALHPLMADLARQVGGTRVEVYDVASEAGNLHHFEPRPADLQHMQASAVVLASGKNLEPYLDRLKSSLGGIPIIEVGRSLPSLSVDPDLAHDGCASHRASAIDPHWWHGVDNMRRAARVVAQAFARQDPANEEYFLNRATAYGQQLDDLKRWALEELEKIPRGQRKLVTAHNAFGYFAKEFGFEVIAIAGLNKEQNTTPREQAATLDAVMKSGVRAVFPEMNTNHKSLDSIVSSTGTHLGPPLIADGNGPGKLAGFEAMFRYNVATITQALTTSP